MSFVIEDFDMIMLGFRKIDGVWRNQIWINNQSWIEERNVKLKKDLTKVFNEYIKVKHSEDGWCSCFTCGRVYPLRDPELHCGHFLPKSCNPVHQFNEDNCRPQCQRCNFNDGERELFEKALRADIGDDKVDELIETRFGDSKRSHAWYQDMIKTYLNKLKDLY